jgi:predicted glycoside hydrolase/deacetylase ChbG (UPF0249 family)
MNRRELLTTGLIATGAILAGAGRAADTRNLAERLGHPKGTRMLMIHADDVGMCRSVNATTIKAMTEGVTTCGSVMVPCPWFPEIAAWSKEHPDADLGLHLTLTSEWRNYRWRSVSPPDKVKGLLDPDGFMWRSVEQVVKHASPEEVAIEIKAQIDRARQFGMKPTHVDSHMGTLFADVRYFKAYTRVAREAGLLPMVLAPTPEVLAEAREIGLEYTGLAKKLESEGFVLLDQLSTGLKGNNLAERTEDFKRYVRGLKPGITELIVHLAGNDDEIQHVTGNWAARFHDFTICTDPAIRRFLADEGVKLVGYKDLLPLWKP